MANFKFYEKDGRKYKRQSTIMDFFPHPDLVDWKVKVGKAEAGRIQRKALKIGSRVDELCEKDVVDGSYKLRKADPFEVRSCMEAWEHWKQDYPERFREINETQRTVYYPDWGVAGTADLLSPLRITDVKTSKRVALMYWVQLGFYNREFKRPEKWVLDLSKGLGDYDYVKCPEEYSQEYLEQVFVGMLNVYNFFNEDNQEERL